MNNPKKVNEFNVGGKHGKNKNGGIPFSNTALVEEDETSVKFGEENYIFSNMLFLNDSDYHIPVKLPRDLSFSDASKYIEDKFSEGGSRIEAETKLEALIALRAAQEMMRSDRGMLDNQQVFEEGGMTEADYQSQLDQSNKSHEAVIEKEQSRMAKSKKASAALNLGSLAANLIPVAGPFISMGIKAADKIQSEAVRITSENKIKKATDSIKANTESVKNNMAVDEANKVDTTVYGLGGIIGAMSTVDKIGAAATVINTASSVAGTIAGARSKKKLGGQDSIPYSNVEPYSGKNEMYPGTYANSVNDSTEEFARLDQQDTDAELGRIGESYFRDASLAAKYTNTKVPNLLDKNYKPPTTKPEPGFGAELTKSEKVGMGVQLGAAGLSTALGMILAKKSPNVRNPQIGEDRVYEKLKMDEARRDVQRSQSTANYAMSQNANGDFGAYAQGVSNVAAKSSEGLAKLYAAEQQFNNEGEFKNDMLNQRKNTMQAQIDMKADDLNAQNEAAYNDQMAAYRENLFANLGSVGKSVQNVGQGDRELKAYKKLFKSEALTQTV